MANGTRKSPSLEPSAGANAARAPSLSLPKGGGAIRGIGEKFAANPVTGTGSLSVPIYTSPGRSGFGPQLSLSYDSGSGNSPFGVGWSLSLPSITRKTDKGLPRYIDADESDVFILSGTEDLVPVLKADGTRHQDDTTAPGFRIERYRPRVEGLFARIERWTSVADPSDVHWRSISKDNILTLYGKDTHSRITDPEDARRIFSWLICETRDDKGNAVLYQYKPEDGAGVDPSRANEKNRGDHNDPRRGANRYLKRIRYGNRTPLLNDAGQRPRFLTEAQVLNAGWMFEVVLDYGEHDPDAPKPDDAGQWAYRGDPFSSYRQGFEVRTCRRCHRVLMFHHFAGEQGVGDDCLVRSTDFTYSPEQGSASACKAIYTFLSGVTQTGYRREGDGYLRRSLPSVEFEYTQPIVRDLVEEVDTASLENLPTGVDGAVCQWTDLHGDGIPGVLTEQADAWWYKRNLSPISKHPFELAPLEQVAAKPNLALGRAQFMDLAGDGQPDLVVLGGPTPGLYEHDEEEGWQPFRPFTSPLDGDARDPNLRFVDLNGDGHADVLITEDDAFVWHPSLAEEGFGPAIRAQQAPDEESGPRLVFADGTQSIHLADMSGSGLTDLVRIRNGEVCYWPNLGYARFGPKVTMDHAPHFDHPGHFNYRRVRLADIDGTGTTDIIYLHRDGVRLYFNQSGNGWSEPQVLGVSPRVDDLVSIMPADLLGNGTSCLVWSSSLPGDARRPMRYINLMGRQKPHLLVKTVNNLGAETRVQYAPSTQFYLQDKRDGRPWITRLPFPVHVVERVETYDHISRNNFVTRYAYHHGYFDGEEREFRGFGMVEQWDTEEFAVPSAGGEAGDEAPAATNVEPSYRVPPVLTKTWFHTGAFVKGRQISKQFEHEYYREGDPSLGEGALADDELQAILLPDTELPADLPREEMREACRALKGSILRQEVYGLDRGPDGLLTEESDRPYSVSERSYTIKHLQPRGHNRHAVFYAHPLETLDLHYERELVELDGVKRADPRVSHALTLKVDDYGNVERSVSIGYRRRPVPGLQSPEQEETHVTLTVGRFVNCPDEEDWYRAGLPVETRSYELVKPPEPAVASGLVRVFSLGEVDGLIEQLLPSDQIEPSAAASWPYEEWDWRRNPAHTPPDTRLRLIEHIRTLYRPDDLGASRNDPRALLPLGDLESLALPGETYKLAFTPGLLSHVFRRPLDALQPPGPPVPEDLLPNPADVLGGQGAGQGGYVDMDGDDHWWIPTGRVFLSPKSDDGAAEELIHARKHFFLAHRFQDAFGQNTIVSYDEPHSLLIRETRDPLGNLVTVGERDADGNLTAPGNDYRVLQPRLISDANRNRSQVAFDALGMVVGTAVIGKCEEDLGDSMEGFEADLSEAAILDHLANPLVDPHAILGPATTRLAYDLFAYERTKGQPDAQPSVVYTLARETHDADLEPGQQTKVQHSFSYSDGFGREIQKKVQAEPGQLVASGPAVSPRWVGSGWTIFNNKGKPVRQYEPFFSPTHGFEFGAQVGVSLVLFYDPVERVVATLHPNDTYEKVVFDPWRQVTYDANDTVVARGPQTGDPRIDPDIQGYVREYFKTQAAAWQTWHAQRQGGALGLEEQAAASKAAIHADTPTAAYLDTLGRVFLAIAHNRFERYGVVTEEEHRTRIVFDIEGNQRGVIDAEDRIVMRYDYDMLGNRIHQASMEAGERWMLNDVAGKPLYAWNSRDHRFRTTYDPLRRPKDSCLSEAGGAEKVVGRSIYGESRPNPEAGNLRDKLVELHDQAGVTTNDKYDFKGNLLESQCRLAQEYKSTLDWSGAVPLEPATYTSRTRYDALNRPTQLTAPHSDQAGKVNVIQPIYNEANLLEQVHAWLNRNAEPGGLLDPATANLHAVTDIDYDAKGQRTLIDYGNGVKTTYTYDPLTFRLTKLMTRRPAGLNGLASRLFTDPTVVQDLRYAYDPAGNITRIADAAPETIFYNNQQLDPLCDYTYDAVYRLIEATGREHLGQTGGVPNAPTPHSYNDAPRVGLLQPNDGNAMGTYCENYVYDAAGNIMEMIHRVACPGAVSWRRAYNYSEPSQLEPGKQSNRLTNTTIGGASETYSAAGDGYDAHGNMLRTPHLQVMQWDFKDHLQMTQRQAVNAGDADGVQHQGERTWYVYDSTGQRVRKVTERATGQVKDERIYLGGLEIYRKNGATPLVRETLHIMDDTQRIALVETRTQGNEPGVPAQVIRYQFSNHLGSASLELDDQAQIIAYEEYTPYGSTAYQAVRSQTETPKRYRYTGKERDEESGLYYHGARYYAPWLARWLSTDPIGVGDGANLYAYVKNNSVNRIDRIGTQGTPGGKGTSSALNLVEMRTVGMALFRGRPVELVAEELTPVSFGGLELALGPSPSASRATTSEPGEATVKVASAALKAAWNVAAKSVLDLMRIYLVHPDYNKLPETEKIGVPPEEFAGLEQKVTLTYSSGEPGRLWETVFEYAGLLTSAYGAGRAALKGLGRMAGSFPRRMYFTHHDIREMALEVAKKLPETAPEKHVADLITYGVTPVRGALGTFKSKLWQGRWFDLRIDIGPHVTRWGARQTIRHELWHLRQYMSMSPETYRRVAQMGKLQRWLRLEPGARLSEIGYMLFGK